jgi:Ran GTPase-activating protein (RanGAP) involved in mRNA processing and transport
MRISLVLDDEQCGIIVTHPNNNDDDIFLNNKPSYPGAVNLCRGLRTNGTLKQLHMSFCNIEQDAGNALAELLANYRSSLEVLNLSGNKLGGLGLSAICRGIMVNTKLAKLMIADNMIDQVTQYI